MEPFFKLFFILLLTKAAAIAAPFIIKIKTDNNGTSADTEFTIPTYPYDSGNGYNYSVDCDYFSGIFTADLSEQTADATCSYDSAGTHTIAIDGTFPRIYFNDGGDKEKLLSIEKWGDIHWNSMEKAFYGCSNLQLGASTGSPDLSGVTIMDYMFAGASSLSQNINFWNVSHVQRMNYLFNGATNFNQPLDTWDVSNVTHMTGMFRDAIHFNRPLNDWNVSSVISMGFMFQRAADFNQSLSQWDISHVQSLQNMFQQASSFDNNISEWNTSNVTTLAYLFDHTPFNQPLNDWDVSAVTDMRGVFAEAGRFNQPLDTWDVSNVTHMTGMFSGALRFDQNISDWNTSSVTDMSLMFSHTNAFNQKIGKWDVSHVVSMRYMFNMAWAFNQDIGDWNTSSVTDMAWMFEHATVFNQDIGDWDISGVTDMSLFLAYGKLSVSQYDSLLERWSGENLQNGVPFSGGNSRYCNAENARNTLVSGFGWTVSDDGRDCTFLITAPDHVTVRSGRTAVETVTVNAAAATFGIVGGADSGFFAIDSASGALRFVGAPDFDHPADNNGDNIYRVQVKADSGSGLTDIQTVRVEVIEADNSAVMPAVYYLLLN